MGGSPPRMPLCSPLLRRWPGARCARCAREQPAPPPEARCERMNSLHSPKSRRPRTCRSRPAAGRAPPASRCSTGACGCTPGSPPGTRCRSRQGYRAWRRTRTPAGHRNISRDSARCGWGLGGGAGLPRIWRPRKQGWVGAGPQGRAALKRHECRRGQGPGRHQGAAAKKGHNTPRPPPAAAPCRPSRPGSCRRRRRR